MSSGSPRIGDDGGECRCRALALRRIWAPARVGHALGSLARVGNAGSSGSAMWCCDVGARISSSLEIGVNGGETGSVASDGTVVWICGKRGLFFYEQ
ncbi:hypothetical protein FH972_027272 [Carpinus fangiana]|uniref:Uncharacterized protein n=1 Tax=Carpinus fangiana TaxID=176857 RepID=A0A5N6L7R5_9ROSI|nr:hypothetical protein FH972_027272 [Carpinus fangiana]